MKLITSVDGQEYSNTTKPIMNHSNGRTKRRLHLTKKQQLDIAKDINMLNEVHLLVD